MNKFGFVEFPWVVVGIVVVAAAIYLILRAWAMTHPNGVLAQPKGVRDVWIMICGTFVGVIIIGLICCIPTY